MVELAIGWTTEEHPGLTLSRQRKLLKVSVLFFLLDLGFTAIEYTGELNHSSDALVSRLTLFSVVVADFIVDFVLRRMIFDL